MSSLRETKNRTYHEAQSYMEYLPNYYAWIYRKFNHYLKGYAVELGCGAGHGIDYYMDKVINIYAVDYNIDLLKEIKRKYSTSKVNTIQADLINDWYVLSEIQANIVIMLDVLEHFKDDFSLINNAKRLLKPDGVIALKVPAQKRLYSLMDEASGHYRRYDKDDLLELAKRANLNIIKISPINPLGALVYRFKNQKPTNFSKSFSPLQLKIINRFLPMIASFDYLKTMNGLSWIVLLKNKS